MVVHRPHRKVQLLGDVLAGHAPCGEQRDVALPAGERHHHDRVRQTGCPGALARTGQRRRTDRECGRRAAVSAPLERLRGLVRRLGREEEGTEPLEAVRRPASASPSPLAAATAWRRVRRDEVALAHRRQLTEPFGHRLRLAEADHVVEEPRLRAAVAGLGSGVGAAAAPLAPGRSPPATSAHARPSSCSAG